MRALPAVLLLASFAAANLPAVAADGAADHPMRVAVSFAPVDLAALNGGRLPPETGTAKYDVVADVNYPPVSACSTLVTVTYRVVTKDPYVTAILSPLSVSQMADFNGDDPSTPADNLVGPSGNTQAFRTRLTLSTSRDAPALQNLHVEIAAKAVAGTLDGDRNCNLASGESSGAVELKNDFVARVQYQPSSYILKTGQNSAVNFGLRVTNLGNGPTRIHVQAEAAGPKSLESLVPPTDLHMLARATDGPSARTQEDLIIQARTPHATGYRNSFYSVVLTLDAAYDGALAGATASTDHQAIALSVQVQGVYVPGFDAASLLAALGIGLAAMGLVRRRG